MAGVSAEGTGKSTAEQRTAQVRRQGGSVSCWHSSISQDTQGWQWNSHVRSDEPIIGTMFLLPITKKFPDIVLYCMLIHSQQRLLLSTNVPEIKNRLRPWNIQAWMPGRRWQRLPVDSPRGRLLTKSCLRMPVSGHMWHHAEVSRNAFNGPLSFIGSGINKVRKPSFSGL